MGTKAFQNINVCQRKELLAPIQLGGAKLSFSVLYLG
jgi:hypothetical protein